MAKWEQVPGAINPLFLSTSAEEGVSSGGNVWSIGLEYRLVHICRRVVRICGFRGLVNRIIRTNILVLPIPTGTNLS